MAGAIPRITQGGEELVGVRHDVPVELPLARRERIPLGPAQEHRHVLEGQRLLPRDQGSQISSGVTDLLRDTLPVTRRSLSQSKGFPMDGMSKEGEFPTKLGIY